MFKCKIFNWGIKAIKGADPPDVTVHSPYAAAQLLALVFESPLCADGGSASYCLCGVCEDSVFIDSTNKNIYPNHISFSVVTNSRFLVTGVTLDSKKRV